MFRIRDNKIVWVECDSLAWCEFEKAVNEMREKLSAGYWLICNDDMRKTHIYADPHANDWRDVVNSMQ